MKKLITLFLTIMILFVLNVFVSAEGAAIDKQNEKLPVEGKDISLTELIGISEEDAENVTIHYNGEVYEIDVTEFYKAINGISLTDIEDMPLTKSDKDKVSLPGGMYIMVNGFDGYAFITDDCKVDKYGRHFSSIPNAEYTIKFADREKITTLFSKSNLPSLKTNKTLYIVLFIVLFAIAFTVAKISVKRKNS